MNTANHHDDINQSQTIRQLGNVKTKKRRRKKLCNTSPSPKFSVSFSSLLSLRSVLSLIYVHVLLVRNMRATTIQSARREKKNSRVRSWHNSSNSSASSSSMKIVSISNHHSKARLLGEMDKEGSLHSLSPNTSTSPTFTPNPTTTQEPTSLSSQPPDEQSSILSTDSPAKADSYDVDNNNNSYGEDDDDDDDDELILELTNQTTPEPTTSPSEKVDKGNQDPTILITAEPTLQPSAEINESSEEPTDQITTEATTSPSGKGEDDDDDTSEVQEGNGDESNPEPTRESTQYPSASGSKPSESPSTTNYSNFPSLPLYSEDSEPTKKVATLVPTSYEVSENPTEGLSFEDITVQRSDSPTYLPGLHELGYEEPTNGDDNNNNNYDEDIFGSVHFISSNAPSSSSSDLLTLSPSTQQPTSNVHDDHDDGGVEVPVIVVPEEPTNSSSTLDLKTSAPTPLPTNLPTSSPSSTPTNDFVENSPSDITTLTLIPNGSDEDEDDIFFPTNELTDRQSLTAEPTFDPSLSLMPTNSSMPTEASTETQPTEVPTEQPTEQEYVIPPSFFDTTTSPTMSQTTPPQRSPTRSPTRLLSLQPIFRPTRRPSVKPTGTPTVEPLEEPSQKPTLPPTRFPTSPPVPFPTEPPTPMPTLPPTPSPTNEPSVDPTAAPTPSTPSPSLRPSAHPTPQPTPQPTPEPSTNPTITPSFWPSYRPSLTKSQDPTPSGTLEPSISPQPSASPTVSYQPTNFPTDTPSAVPSLSPSRAPSSVPSFVPSLVLQTGMVKEARMRLFILKRMNEVDVNVWTSTTEDFLMAHLREVKPPLEVVELTVTIVQQIAANRRYLQQLNGGGSLLVVFNVSIAYRSQVDDDDVDLLVWSAFDLLQDRTEYILKLQKRSLTFQEVELVQFSVEGYEPPATLAPTPGKKDTVNIGVIVGATVGGVALIILVILLFLRRCSEKNDPEEHDEEIKGLGALPSTNKNMKVSTEILVEPQDDVSTLGDPMYGQGGMIMGGMEKDEITASVGDDYDYTKRYRSIRDPLSIADTTNTRDRTASEDMSKMSSVQSTSMSKLGKMGENLFADDASFEEQFFSDPEERFDVVAPAGKLGMVIDTPNGGIPVVHAIKDTSVLADQIRVGDRLLSVDGEDCTGMTAMQVSKMISLKSEKPARVLVFTRSASKA